MTPEQHHPSDKGHEPGNVTQRNVHAHVSPVASQTCLVAGYVSWPRVPSSTVYGTGQLGVLNSVPHDTRSLEEPRPGGLHNVPRDPHTTLGQRSLARVASQQGQGPARRPM